MTLNFEIEFGYFELSAGVTTLDQYRFVQDRWHVVNPANLTELQDVHPEESGVRAAVQRLRARTELLAWLPKVRGIQLELIRYTRIPRAWRMLARSWRPFSSMQ